MKTLNVEQLLIIDGGISVSGTLLNSFNSLIKTVLDVGRSIGTAIVRISNGKMCRV